MARVEIRSSRLDIRHFPCQDIIHPDQQLLQDDFHKTQADDLQGRKHEDSSSVLQRCEFDTCGLLSSHIEIHVSLTTRNCILESKTSSKLINDTDKEVQSTIPSMVSLFQLKTPSFVSLQAVKFSRNTCWVIIKQDVFFF